MTATICEFEAKRAPKSFNQFNTNRALDFASDEIKEINGGKEDPKSDGPQMRSVIGALLKYAEKYRDVPRMSVFTDVMFNARGSIALMHPYMLFAVVWGAFL